MHHRNSKTTIAHMAHPTVKYHLHDADILSAIFRLWNAFSWGGRLILHMNVYFARMRVIF